MNTRGNLLMRIAIIILSISFVVTVFPVASDAEFQKPTELIPLYTDDFSDGVIAGNIESYRFYPDSPADTLTESDGKLIFERKKWIWNSDTSYGEPAVRIYPNESHTPVSGRIFTEFNLSKTREVVRIRFCDSGHNYLTQIAWEGDSFKFGWLDSSNASNLKTLNIPSSSEVKISLYADFSSVRPQFWMWINDELQVDGGYSVTSLAAQNFSMVQIYTLLYSSYSKAGTFSVSNFGTYVVTDEVPGVESVICDNGFDSDNTPSLVSPVISGAGSADVSGGTLNISKTSSDLSQVGALVYTGTNTKTSAYGLIGVEFDIQRDNGNNVQIRSMDSNGNIYYSFVWRYGSVTADYSETPTSAGYSHNVWSKTSNDIHVNLLFDTDSSRYWLWLNGDLAVGGKYSRNVGVGSVCYTMFYLESVNNITVDNYKVYHAVPPSALRLGFDLKNFGYDDMVTDSLEVENVITSSLKLPFELRYGTTVSWTSSHPDIINPATGEVVRPVDSAENPVVTLTAEFNNSGLKDTREYTFTVLRSITDSANISKYEVEDIDYSHLTVQNPGEIKTSLALMDKGFYGSEIIWSSSDSGTITPSGRVVRPRFNEADKNVILTATIGSYSKEFEFTVLADEKPSDPMHTSNEEFFGVWNGTEFSTTPQLDYSLDGMSEVLSAVQANDYPKASDELLTYFKTRNVASPVGGDTRYPGWVDARSDGVYELGEAASYWKGHAAVTSDEYEPVTVSLHNPSSILNIECKTFELIARYNENTSAYILGTDSDSAPVLTLRVNGTDRDFRASHTATIRAGSYSRTHIDNNAELQAKMFGGFLGDETYRILLAFDLSDISANDTVTDASLTVHARKSSASAKDKELWIIDNRNRSWNEADVIWEDMNFAVHNYNGLEGGTDWNGAKASDVEFAYQMPRFTHARSALSEYKATGDEKYAYALLSQVMDIICDTGDKTPYPRSLDAAIRMHNLVPLMNYIKSSPYLTADFCTAFMKYMYKQFEYFPSRVDATGNWREYEQLAVLYATTAYPELTNSKLTREACILSWQNAMSKSFMPDGSYIEDTGGYHRSVFAMYRDFKNACINSGVELPAEFDDMLHKSAKYMLLTNAPGGLTLQYGDEGGGKSSANRYTDVCDWYDDDELRFIDSAGADGIEPSWTSYQFPDGRYTMMRSDWSDTATYLHTNVRGGGGHGHADDNSIILFGGGRRLLVDAGKFTYNSYDPARMYGQSTQGHNTVVINDASQRSGWADDEEVKGIVHQWHTSPAYDFLAQSTIAYPDYDHMRSILFIKDGVFVVSDRMVPANADTVNNYKQYWHMHPEANISADSGAKVLRSDYSSGTNLVLASADEVSVSFEEGYYDVADGTVTANTAGIFEKNSVGSATFDTVMCVTDSTDTSVVTKRLDTGYDTSEVTAFRFDVTKEGETETYYYIYNYLHDNTTALEFEGFSTDARVALVSVDADDSVKSVLMTDGSYISRNNTKVIESESVVGDIYAEFARDQLSITTSDTELSPEGISVTQSRDIESLLYNGKFRGYTITDGMIHVGSDAYTDVLADAHSVEAMMLIAADITPYDGRDYLNGNLNFSYIKGDNGSDIKYTVSDESIISSVGTVTRDIVDKPVNVTATVSQGGMSVTEEFEFTVPGIYNKIGRENMPFISNVKSVEYTVTEVAGLSGFSNNGGTVSFTTGNVSESGFWKKYSSPVSGVFAQEIVFSSDSDALRIRMSDSNYGRKLDIYYVDNGTLIIGGAENVTHTANFAGKEIKLNLIYDMSAYTADVYVDGELWLDDFALVSGGYKNICYILTTHHRATILGKWREGDGTTNIHSFDMYDVIADSQVSPVVLGKPLYSNAGVPAQGINSVTVPVLATCDSPQAEEATLVYAIYSNDNGIKKLVGIQTEKMVLDKFSHKAYTVSAEINSDIGVSEQRIFVVNNLSDIKPLEVYRVN